ncbi:MAG: hypothetical protein WCA81_03895 [Rhizomicrobium sp.]
MASVSWSAEPVNPALHTSPMTRLQPNQSAVPVATGWALQGRVVDARSQPAANFTVFFVDGRGNFLAQYGLAYTDNTGHFFLNYAGASTGTQLFIEVASADGNPVYRSTTPFQPQLGTVSFQSITLRAPGKPIGAR